jgi:hypothetical protein
MVVSVGSNAHLVQWGWCRVGDPSPARPRSFGKWRRRGKHSWVWGLRFDGARLAPWVWIPAVSPGCRASHRSVTPCRFPGGR